MGDNVIDRGAVHVSDTRWCFALMRGSLMEFLGSRFKRLFVGRTRSEVKPPPGRIVHRLAGTVC